MQKKIMDRNELRRLEKAAREKDKKHLLDWAMQFEEQIRQEYEDAFQKELAEAIDNFCVGIVYTLRFGEYTNFGNKRIDNFMNDLFITVNMFKTGESNPDAYKKELEESGIKIFRR